MHMGGDLPAGPLFHGILVLANPSRTLNARIHARRMDHRYPCVMSRPWVTTVVDVGTITLNVPTFYGSNSWNGVVANHSYSAFSVHAIGSMFDLVSNQPFLRSWCLFKVRLAPARGIAVDCRLSAFEAMLSSLAPIVSTSIVTIRSIRHTLSLAFTRVLAVPMSH